jgi:hypothetical protein
VKLSRPPKASSAYSTWKGRGSSELTGLGMKSSEEFPPSSNADSRRESSMFAAMKMRRRLNVADKDLDTMLVRGIKSGRVGGHAFRSPSKKRIVKGEKCKCYASVAKARANGNEIEGTSESGDEL